MLDELIERLKNYRIAYISEQTGVHWNTIQRILSGEVSDPRIGTVLKLQRFLDDRP
jgi:DNA-binding phage protein